MLGLSRSYYSPKGRRAPAPLARYDFTQGSLPGGVSFARASAGDFIAADGSHVLAAVDVPRFDHDPVTLAPRGLLVEPTRDNLLLWNQDFSNPVWTTSSFSASTQTTAAPDGSTITGWNLGNGYIFQDVATAAGVPHTVSVWVKANKTCLLGLRDPGSSTHANVGISVGTEWQRFQITKPVYSSTRFLLDGRSVLGFGTSNLIVFIWMPQMEPGDFSTSPISSTASPVTRAADVVGLTDQTGIFDVSVTDGSGAKTKLLAENIAPGWWPNLGLTHVKSIDLYPTGTL